MSTGVPTTLNELTWKNLFYLVGRRKPGGSENAMLSQESLVFWLTAELSADALIENKTGILNREWHGELHRGYR